MDPQSRTVEDEVCPSPTSAFHRDTIPNEASARPEPTPSRLAPTLFPRESGPNNESLYLRKPRASYTSRGMPPTDTSTTSCQTDEAWITKVRNNINLAQPRDHPNGPCTIFKVPEHIRQLNREAYEPVIAFLGPFHRNSRESSFMKCYKWQCVRHLLSRHQSQEQESQLLNKCLLELKKKVDKVRSCYSEEFSELDAEDMAVIMLLDGCFIIYLMCPMKESWNPRRLQRMMEKREGEVVLNIDEKDEQLEGPTMAGLFTIDVVIYDLLKLENQIPFFIIKLLFDLLKPCEDG
ncbi:UPF0481 protein At3g47200-like [Phoenix dactylifera]|uniref:UPF0481 protein At3g47200-like n=1 Tax=Phoenix dactylifera TaxID=42345 RepID=A0A8B9AQV6_PHODC|nr:UPF0481 protein At3g47200-like [Phoenix dactylifera]